MMKRINYVCKNLQIKPKKQTDEMVGVGAIVFCLYTSICHPVMISEMERQ